MTSKLAILGTREVKHQKRSTSSAVFSDLIGSFPMSKFPHIERQKSKNLLFSNLSKSLIQCRCQKNIIQGVPKRLSNFK